jgi:hypothetical protein
MKAVKLCVEADLHFNKSVNKLAKLDKTLTVHRFQDNIKNDN